MQKQCDDDAPSAAHFAAMAASCIIAGHAEVDCDNDSIPGPGD